MIMLIVENTTFARAYTFAGTFMVYCCQSVGVALINMLSFIYLYENYIDLTDTVVVHWFED